MRSSAWVVLASVLLSGCVGGAGPASLDKGAAGGQGLAGGLAPPTTLSDLLKRTPHLKIIGPATFDLEITKVDAGSWAFNATLIHLFVPMKPGYQTFTGSPYLIIFIPLLTEAAPTGCGRVPQEIHYRFGPDAGTNGQGNLSGNFPAGWYHAVILAKTPASYRVSFNSTSKEVVRPWPGVDPWVSAGYKSWGGQRSYEESAEMAEQWFSFARHSTGSGADLGRELRVTIALGQDCASSTYESNPLTPTQLVTGTRSVWTHATGTGAPAHVRGSYKPATEGAAPTQATMELGWVSVARTTLPPR